MAAICTSCSNTALVDGSTKYNDSCHGYHLILQADGRRCCCAFDKAPQSLGYSYFFLTLYQIGQVSAANKALKVPASHANLALPTALPTEV